MKNLRNLRFVASVLFLGCFTAASLGWEPVAELLQLQLGPMFVRLLASFSWGLLTAVGTIFFMTLIFGRLYCAVFCPLGVFQELLWYELQGCLGKTRTNLRTAWSFRWLRYPLLALVATLLLAGTLFPATWLLPSSNFVMMLNNLFRPEACAFPAAWGMMILLIVLIRLRGRVYCNSICPVGALLSLVSRFSFFRVRIRKSCVHCGLCEKKCPAGCLDSQNGRVNASECFVCLECLTACRTESIAYASPFWGKERSENAGARSGQSGKTSQAVCASEKRDASEKGETSGLSENATGAKVPVSRAASGPNRVRRTILISAATAAGIGVGRFLNVRNVRKADELKADTERQVLPPGAWSYEKFRTRCVGCGLCVGVCRGKAVSLSMGQHGLYGTLQPFLNFEQGKCLSDCAACMEICPTGALEDIGLEAKSKLRLGIGSYDPLKCRAFLGTDPCAECERACPQRAISMVDFRGRKIPKFNDDLCTGCGACQLVCPQRVMRVIPAVKQDFLENLHDESETESAESATAEKQAVKQAENQSAKQTAKPSEKQSEKLVVEKLEDEQKKGEKA